MRFCFFWQAIPCCFCKNHQKKIGFLARLLMLSLFWLLSSGCSYLTREPGRPPRIDGAVVRERLRKVYVANFTNNSYAPSLHTMLSRYVKMEVDRRGRLLQTRERGQAQYILRGEIVHYQRIGSLMDNANRQVSSEVLIIVKVDLIGKDGYKVVLPRNEIPARGYYSTQMGYRETEEQAQSRILSNLAIRLVEEVEEGWYSEILRKHRLSKR